MTVCFEKKNPINLEGHFLSIFLYSLVEGKLGGTVMHALRAHPSPKIYVHWLDKTALLLVGQSFWHLSSI